MSPLDPSIPLGIRPVPFADPMQTLAQIAALQAHRENSALRAEELTLRQQQTQSQIEQREQAIAKAKQEAADIEEKKQENARITAYLTSGQPFKQEELQALVKDPVRATTIGQGIETLTQVRQKNITDKRTATIQLLGGVEALPPELRTAVWSGLRQTAIDDMGFDGSKIPETYSPGWVAMSLRSLLTPEQQVEKGEPKYQSFPEGQAVFNVNQPVTPGVTPSPAFTTPRGPAQPGTMEEYATATPERRAELLRQRTAWEQAGRAPVTPNYVWASDDKGNLTRATDAEVRAKGLKPVEAGTTQESREKLIEAVLNNPGLWDQITPTERGKIAGDLEAKGFTGFGRPLPEAAMKKLAAADLAITSLRDLREVVHKNEQYIGPIAGWQRLNPYSPAVQAQADIDRVRQRVGKALEEGVLRKEDEEKYKKILATLNDTPATAVYKIDQLLQDLDNEKTTYLHQQRLAGRRVPQGPTVGDRGMLNGQLVEWQTINGQSGWVKVP